MSPFVYELLGFYHAFFDEYSLLNQFPDLWWHRLHSFLHRFGIYHCHILHLFLELIFQADTVSLTFLRPKQVIDIVQKPGLDLLHSPKTLALLLECVLPCQVSLLEHLELPMSLVHISFAAETELNRLVFDRLQSGVLSVLVTRLKSVINH